MTRLTGATALALACVLCVSCSKDVTFARDDPSWRYETYSRRIDADVLLVIDKLDLRRKVKVQFVGTHQVMTGDMLQQLASHELSSMFASYRESDAYRDPPPGRRSLTLTLSVPRYRFEDTQAEVTIRAIAHGSGSVGSFDKEYTARGNRMGHQAGSPKAAVRNSSLGAFQGAFDALSKDLRQAFGEPPSALPLE